MNEIKEVRIDSEDNEYRYAIYIKDNGGITIAKKHKRSGDTDESFHGFVHPMHLRNTVMTGLFEMTRQMLLRWTWDNDWWNVPVKDRRNG